MTELLVPGPAIGLAALLDLPTQNIRAGWALPPLWHWVYFLERPLQSELGSEGHTRNGIPKPPREGLRRMYAGGRVQTHHPLILGEGADDTAEIVGSRERTGRSGWMTIVTVRRTIRQRDRVAVTDEVDIIYREPAPLRPVEGSTAPSSDAQTGAEVRIDETYLFRFSALTYNAHRIHYDIDYCRDEEDYPNLVVHGPLQALLMCEEARRHSHGHPGTRFDYRLVAPLTLGQGLFVEASEATDSAGWTTLVRDARGRTTAMGRLMNRAGA